MTTQQDLLTSRIPDRETNGRACQFAWQRLWDRLLADPPANEREATDNADAEQPEKGKRGAAMSGTTLDAALSYVAAGLSVIPCQNEAKNPLISSWMRFQKELPSEQEIRQWFSQNNRAIGIVCGPISRNREGIDIDNKPQPGYPDAQTLYTALHELVEAEAPGLWRHLVIERTPSNGYHLIYRCSTIAGNTKLAQRPATDEDRKVANNLKLDRVTLIETRGPGGYFISAPSRGYTVLQGELTRPPLISPEAREILFRAARSLNLFIEPTKVIGNKSSLLSEGTRPGDDYNQRTTATDVVRMLEDQNWQLALQRGNGVCYMRRPGKQQGWSATVGYGDTNLLYVFSSNAAPFEPDRAYTPFAVYTLLSHDGDFEAAARALAQQGYGDQLSGRSSTQGYDPKNPKNAQKTAPGNSEDFQYFEDAQDNLDWQPPVSFYAVDLPSFPNYALPDWLQAYVEAVATATQTPNDLPGMLALAGCAVAIAKKVEIRVRDGYTEPANIYILAVQPPGTRKSSVFKKLTAPLVEWEQEAAEQMAPDVAAAESEYRIMERRLHKAQDEAAKAGPEERTAKEQEATELARKLAGMQVPALPRLVADDVSPERLATLLRDHRGRMAVMSPEGDLFEIMAGRYSSTGAPNFGVYLKGHAGDTLRVDRVGRPPEFVKAPALTVAATVQPDVLHGLTAKPGFRGRGLLGRFLYALPAPTLGARNTNPPTVPPMVEAVYHRDVRALLDLPFGTDDRGNPAPHMLRLDREAEEYLQQFEQWVEPQLGEFGDLGHMTDWAGKLVGAVARITAIFHMATHAEAAAPWEVPISVDTVKAAITIGKYLISHAKAAYGEMGADPAIADAQYLWRFIERKGVTEFTKSNLYQWTRGHFKKIAEMEPALTLLVDHNFIRQRPAAQRSGRGRPLSPEYEVNPLADPNNTKKPN